jgi:uncharacterized membrane protein (DUF106 family)
VSNRPGRAALVAALADWQRHVGALVIVAAAFGVAWRIGSNRAYYTASLVTFTVWMGWFVLTAIEWLRRAEF